MMAPQSERDPPRQDKTYALPVTAQAGDCTRKRVSVPPPPPQLKPGLAVGKRPSTRLSRGIKATASPEPGMREQVAVSRLQPKTSAQRQDRAAFAAVVRSLRARTEVEADNE